MSMEILTHSHLQMRRNCAMSEHYRYELGLTPRNRNSALSIGTAVHKGIETGSVDEALETFSETFPNNQAEYDQLEIDKVTVRSMLLGYFAAYEPFENYEGEIEFEIPIVNPVTGAKSKSFRLAGKVDGLARINDEWWVCEYKTASQLTKAYIDRLQLDTQITTYMHGLQKARGIKIAGVIYRILKKPSIRQKQNETLDAFCERLTNDYLSRPEFYFSEQRLYRSQDDLRAFEVELWMQTQRLLAERREGLHFKNTSRCSEYGGCSYMPLCLGQQDAMNLYEVQEANSELGGIEDGSSREAS